MGALKGKVAVVTGGTNGIGEAVVKRYIKESAKVSVLGRSEEKLTELKETYRDDIETIRCDVTNYEDVERAIEQTVASFGKIDTLVSNAGVFDGFVTLEQLSLEEIDEPFDTLFHINVKGGILAVRACLPYLQEAKGSVIFTLSNAALYPNGGGPLYTATKHALVGVVRELAYELAPDIRVNGVSPGGTLTNLKAIPSLQKHVDQIDPETRKKFIEGRNPLQIAQTPDDHNGAYVLLASDEARAMTGTIIESDGGLGVRGM